MNFKQEEVPLLIEERTPDHRSSWRIVAQKAEVLARSHVVLTSLVSWPGEAAHAGTTCAGVCENGNPSLSWNDHREGADMRCGLGRVTI